NQRKLSWDSSCDCLVCISGIGLVYTELDSGDCGVRHIFSHFITNLAEIHYVVVFVCIKNLLIYCWSCVSPSDSSYTTSEERFILKRIGPKNFEMCCCVARYGFRDLHKKMMTLRNDSSKPIPVHPPGVNDGRLLRIK
ncbi:hypothetical protein HID58_025495, partial [Brassica napus]